MSYASTSNQHRTPPTSPTGSFTSRPVAMTLSSSCSSSRRESFNSAMTTADPYSTCGYSMWATSTSGKPSAYVSDEDLFGNDDEAYLSEPPPPPRSAEVWMARPLLPPVVQYKPNACSTQAKKKRHSNSDGSTTKS
ncbi:uncharacterized protein RCC_10762 [Ramularia collo-cygni]|uniref:Uncharacterized protein n=1 Tax=Ramularia collo-cygni TaxID=112498 RepID=A0A2D3VPJ4_9PEZI|nr:uncharacterized protein RCC_10762 [Ramularia collo-cygni]CZT25034.1 uncharacterized protein RCC_10762 [Ramularia collo-cygni]